MSTRIIIQTIFLYQFNVVHMWFYEADTKNISGSLGIPEPQISSIVKPLVNSDIDS